MYAECDSGPKTDITMDCLFYALEAFGFQFSGRVVDVAVVRQRRAPSIQTFKKTVELPES